MTLPSAVVEAIEALDICPIPEDLERIARLAYAEGRREGLEEAAKVAGVIHQAFADTQDAHHRYSPEPFVPEQFGFDMGEVLLSRRIEYNIRALSPKEAK